MMEAVTPSKEREIVIRSFRDFHEMNVCVELQQRIWGYSDIEVVPGQIFVVAEKTDGQILGAYDGDVAIGFALAFPAVRDRQIYLYSHMVGVLPEYQDRGVGRLLKLAQRDEVLARGIDVIEWTFDPLQLKNAYFNIARLGAVVRHYLPDVYGRTSSPLHGGLATDRLVAEWWVNSARVRDRLANKHGVQNGVCERIALPTAIREICRTSPDKAEIIQRQVRTQFDSLISRGYAAVGFEFDENQGSYILEPYED
jgi:predicted GNAT superfamily acetyltransferase